MTSQALAFSMRRMTSSAGMAMPGTSSGLTPGSILPELYSMRSRGMDWASATRRGRVKRTCPARLCRRAKGARWNLARAWARSSSIKRMASSFQQPMMKRLGGGAQRPANAFGGGGNLEQRLRRPRGSNQHVGDRQAIAPHIVDHRMARHGTGIGSPDLGPAEEAAGRLEHQKNPRRIAREGLVIGDLAEKGGAAADHRKQ